MRNAYRFPDAECTTLQDLVESFKYENSRNLVVDVKHLHASNHNYDLNVLVEKHADLDSEFLAYDIDDNELITIKGWLFNIDYNSSMTL